MGHIGTKFKISRVLPCIVMVLGVFMPLCVAAQTAHHEQIKKVTVSPLILVARPGKALLMRRPARTQTIAIEDREGMDCARYVIRSDEDGVAEIALANTAHCRAPRLVVQN